VRTLVAALTFTFLLILADLSTAWGQGQVVEKSIHPTCRVGNVFVGYVEGQDNALIDSLVSKFPTEQLTPLAIPQPILPIPIEYINPEVQSYYKESNRRERMQSDAAYSAMTMIRKAYESGVRIFIYSAYRSYDQQCEVFRSKVATEMKSGLALQDAIKLVNLRSAFPGESEHQLGTTMDVVTDDKDVGYKLKFEFAKTRAYEWLQKNASDYGFVLSYPKADNVLPSQPHPDTKIIFEPWHWRYVGTATAKKYGVCYDKLRMTPQVFLRKLKQDPTFNCEI